MRDSIRANLLGYLSDALEDDEHALVQSWVDRDPQLSQDLSALKGHLDLLASDHGHEEPPSGLALRTCDWIFPKSRVNARVNARARSMTSQGCRRRTRTQKFACPSNAGNRHHGVDFRPSI